MTQITKIALSTILLLSVGTVSVNADVAKGQKLYLKKLKSACGINGATMAAKHSMKEWTEIQSSGKLADEIKTICPTVSDDALKPGLMEHYYDFFNEYASDSGNVPSC